MRQPQDQGTDANLPAVGDARSDSQNNGAALADTATGATQTSTQGTVTNRDNASESAAERLARLSTDYRNAQAELTRTQQRASKSETDNSQLQATVHALQQQISQLLSQTQQAPNSGGYEKGYGDMDDAAARELAQLRTLIDQQNAVINAIAQKSEIARQAAEFALVNDQALQANTRTSKNREEVRSMFPNLNRDTEDYLVGLVDRGEAIAAIRAGVLAQQAVIDQAKQESQRQYQVQQDLAGGGGATSRQSKETPPLDYAAINARTDNADRAGEYMLQRIERMSKLKLR